MTPAEFKAWFDGFTEGMDGPPSIKQWEKITAKVKQIDGTSVLTPIYVDRWWPTVLPRLDTSGAPYRPYPVWCGTTAGAATVGDNTARMTAASQVNPTALLMAEGRADALAAA